MPERRSLRSRASLNARPNASPAAVAMSRPRRTISGSANQSVTVARATSQSPDESKKSIRLTVKMPSNKLREATSGPRKNVAVNSRDTFVGGEILSGPRGSRAKRSIVVESESEEEEDDEAPPSDEEPQDEEDEEQEEDGEEDDEEAEDDSADVDADADADGDVDMDDVPLPPPPILKMTGPTAKPSVTITPAAEGKTKGVVTKEMELADDDDEELSELDSEGEEEGEEDAEGDETGDVDEMDQDDERRSIGTGSRASTPDVSKMTKRQRSRLDQVMGGDFLQLPMGTSVS